MRKNKCNDINQHILAYPKAIEHAMRAIYEGMDIKVDGQTYSYDKQQNILTIKDFYTEMKYKPKFNGIFCNPFAEIIREEN